MSIVVSSEMKSELEAQAASEQRSASSLLRQLIEHALPQHRALQQLAHALYSGTALSIAVTDTIDGEQ